LRFRAFEKSRNSDQFLIILCFLPLTFIDFSTSI